VIIDEAVRDGFLVPPKAVSVPLKFQREGIKYDDLSEEDKDRWDALEWDEDGNVPNHAEAEAVNKWLFNKDTVDKVLEHLMTRGLTVAGGDRLGKTILFAKNQHHAEFIAEHFNAYYPHFKGEFARVITFKTEYAQSLIDNFSAKDKAPHIAVSVDMLDTGIDIPEVVNLVFFKLVRSKTKFWQMLGRGTRLCPDLFGPGQDKAFFCVFDYCQNLEYFSQNIPATEGTLGESLGKRLFNARLEMIGELDHRSTGEKEGRRHGGRCDLRRPEDERRGPPLARRAPAARDGGDEPRQLRRKAKAAHRRARRTPRSGRGRGRPGAGRRRCRRKCRSRGIPAEPRCRWCRESRSSFAVSDRRVFPTRSLAYWGFRLVGQSSAPG
jgi:type I site-specific restriction endonuclease